MNGVPKACSLCSNATCAALQSGSPVHTLMPEFSVSRNPDKGLALQTLRHLTSMANAAAIHNGAFILIRVHNVGTQARGGTPKTQAISMASNSNRKSCHSDHA